mmetsp:Transcript_30161/g.80477  ORF Transcript_30161/g.80477 Transcript_30161/m.80477 type:complete len:481 (-) Transcript_30161:317-1759(-)
MQAVCSLSNWCFDHTQMWVVLWNAVLLAHAANPLVPNNVGVTDPHVHFFNGRAYMYATNDGLTPSGNDGCCHYPWWIWSSEDLEQWTFESEFGPFSWQSKHDFWATDVAERNGRYYWYVSIGADTVAVATSASPTGPWEDPLGMPLLANGTDFDPPIQIRDPGVLQDGDNYYLVFGSCYGKVHQSSCYFVAELNEDMISMKTPRYLTVNDPWGPYGNYADDKPFLHKRGDIYYLSWGCFYATASAVYGPYQYQGSVISPPLIAPDFRIDDITAEPWYSNRDYFDRHASFVEHQGQWYFFCNDRSHSPLLPEHLEDNYRESVAAYLHFFDNGTMAPVIINEHGVSSHDASVGLPAENYFSILGAEKREHPLGFMVAKLMAGSSLTYRNVRNVSSGVTLKVANGGSCQGVVHVSSAGQLHATCTVAPTGGWFAFQDVPCHFISALPQIVRVLTLEFTQCEEAFLNLDHISFTPLSEFIFRLV